MKLERILESLNSLEKNSFIKIIDNIISGTPKNTKTVESLLSNSDQEGLKNLENVAVSKIFSLVEEEYSKEVGKQFLEATSQFDILIDIITRDGNSIMKVDWFSRLYETELKTIKTKTKALATELKNEKTELEASKVRDLLIYEACVHTAYFNDVENNREPKITDDEVSILRTLSNKLNLSQEEIKLTNYQVVPVKTLQIDDVITYLKNIGAVFYSKKKSTIYVADEVVRLLRKLRGKQVADKYFRRVLRSFKEPQINLIAKTYGIDKKLSYEEKIKEIIKEGVDFKQVLLENVYKPNTNLTDKKKVVSELWEKGLNYTANLKGTTLNDKVDNIANHFEELELEDKIGISMNGFAKLLQDMEETLPKVNAVLKLEFEIQDENVLKAELLIDYNIKPVDVLDLITVEDLEIFCDNRSIKKRGNIISNIIEAYKDSDNILLENYVNIGYRDLNLLKENGISIKEAELGLTFEELTKTIFTQLGFNVDEAKKKELNTKKDKIDVLLNLGNNEYILIECKTIKGAGYNKFSSVSRQLKAYQNLAELNNCNIIKSLLIAPEFSDEFINDTELEYDLNLSLITASSLVKILEGFKATNKHKSFPYKLLLRDVLIQEDRIIKAINK
jgi:hypothetical protein